jgi:phage shock protein E
MPLLATTVAALISLAAPAGSALPPPGVIDGATAQRLRAGGATVVDVRSADEYAGGHVPGALNIPHDQIAARLAEVGARDRPVLVYCRSGRRSAMAVAELVRQGFTAVYDFRTIGDWPGPVEKGPPAPRQGPAAGPAGPAAPPPR